MEPDDFLEAHGFLAYEAIVLLQEAGVTSERYAHFRELYLKHFHGFGDMDPDDAVDATDG
jgi:hypothetical protein